MNINVNSGALCRGQGLQDSLGTMTVTVASSKSKHHNRPSKKTSADIYLCYCAFTSRFIFILILYWSTLMPKPKNDSQRKLKHAHILSVVAIMPVQYVNQNKC